MVKLMIIGGGYSQIQLAKAAKNEGYWIIICDPNPNCRARSYADEFYQISYQEKELLLDIAIKAKINGVISNSEPIMHLVSYISDNLGLIGNSLNSINQLMSKNKFRELQEKCNLYSPHHVTFYRKDEILDKVRQLSFPIIIKPGECSGSRGTQKIDNFDEDLISKVYDNCQQYSRNGLVEAEEYVQMPSKVVYEGDLFVWKDEILWDGLFFNVHSKYNLNLPLTDVFPFETSSSRDKIIKNAFRQIFKEAGVSCGQFNVEMFFTEKEELFIIEINVRQGGNGIPDAIKLYSGVDFNRLLVTTSIGDESYWNYLKTFQREKRYICRHMVFPKNDGVYEGLVISPEIRPYLLDCEELAKDGDNIKSMNDASGVIAFLNFDFLSLETQRKYCERLEDLVQVKIS